MAAAQIGAMIAELRKAKGVKQEDIAKAVGISAQAVSKWENGGTPDIELLPRVADYFGVSIDRLFGRSIRDFSGIDTEAINYIAQPLDAFDGEIDKTPDEAHAAAMERAREMCWAVKLGLIGTKINIKIGLPIKQLLEEMHKNSSDEIHLYSQLLNNSGMALMSLSKNLPYFMLFPEPEHGWTPELLGLEEYRKAFAALAEPDILNCLHLIHTKKPDNKFSLEYFANIAGLDAARAEEVLKTLADLGYVEKTMFDVNDAQQTFYSIEPSVIFVMVLLLMRTFIKPPKEKIGFFHRDKPFLRQKEDNI